MHRGRVRDHQEDAALVDPVRDLYVVADGLGGHAAGEVASRIAVATLGRAVVAASPGLLARPQDLISIAIDAADQAIRADARAHRERRGMGSTVVAAHVGPRAVVLGSVGDSRGYRLRGGKLEQLTTDDSAGRHTLTQALGGSAGVHPHILTTAHRAGDLFLLCTDGLYGSVPAPELVQLLEPAYYCAAKVDACARQLVARANEHGGPDNITAILVRVPGHTHCCAFCQACWSHPDGPLGDVKQHRCPLCGELVWRKA
jgi:protein phosphatase